MSESEMRAQFEAWLHPHISKARRPDGEYREEGTHQRWMAWQAAYAQERRAGMGRLFPMQNGPSIPWWLAEVIYAGYSAWYGTNQSLERMAERHGFGWAEVEILWDKRRGPDRYRGRDAMLAALEALKQEDKS